MIAGVLLAVYGLLAAPGTGPAGAEAQWRVAQRLAAEGSPGASAAFERVVGLDPTGPLADDALLALARLSRPPESPAALATVDPARAAAAASMLTRLLETQPRGDRAAEARYLRALVRLAPLPGRDPLGAREDLIEVAGHPAGGRYALLARDALGFLDEAAGQYERAAGSYARVLLDGAGGPGAPEAGCGFARSLLRAGRFGEAAAIAQRAFEAGASDCARDLREIAVRGVLRERDATSRWSAGSKAPVPFAGPRGASLLAAAPDGGFVVYDRKSGAVHAFDRRGAGRGVTPAADVSALAVDPFGRVLVVSAAGLLRIGQGPPETVLSLGSWTSASALAADGAGRVLVADRKGEGVARFTPGVASPETIFEGKGSALAALVGDGERAVACDEKTGGLLVLEAGRAPRPLGTTIFRRPSAIAVDAAGQIAVLDSRQETVSLLDPSGAVRDVLATAALGIERPVAIALAADGALLILDGANGAVSRIP